MIRRRVLPMWAAQLPRSGDCDAEPNGTRPADQVRLRCDLGLRGSGCLLQKAIEVPALLVNEIGSHRFYEGSVKLVTPVDGFR